jgi:hypothetical protein
VKSVASEQVIIKDRINEVMRREFDKMIEESSNDILIKLLLDDKISKLTLEQIRSYLKGDMHA